MGENFTPPTKSTPLNDKKSAQLITSARGSLKQNRVQIRPLGAFTDNKNYFFYLYFFLRLAYRSEPLMDFMPDSSKDVKSRKEVPFASTNDVPVNFGGKPPKNFWGRE